MDNSTSKLQMVASTMYPGSAYCIVSSGRGGYIVNSLEYIRNFKSHVCIYIIYAPNCALSLTIFAQAGGEAIPSVLKLARFLECCKRVITAGGALTRKALRSTSHINFSSAPCTKSTYRLSRVVARTAALQAATIIQPLNLAV